MVQSLAARGGRAALDARTIGNDGTPLPLAADRNQTAAVQPQPDCEPEQPAETRTLGQLQIAGAQERQDLPAIKRRLAQGADPNDTAEHKVYKVHKGYSGVDLSWGAPLFLAAQQGHVEVVDALVDAGADLGWKLDGNPSLGMTALHAAARHGHAGSVRSLAVRGGRAVVDARGNDSRTPLHRAAMKGHPTAAQVLLEAAADTSLIDGAYDTALDVAVEEQSMKHYQSDEHYAANLNGKHEVAACIRQASDEARRLCGARQRLALAKSTLASAEAAAGLRELPYDLLPLIGESVVALGPPVVRVVFRAAADTHHMYSFTPYFTWVKCYTGGCGGSSSRRREEVCLPEEKLMQHSSFLMQTQFSRTRAEQHRLRPALSLSAAAKPFEFAHAARFSPPRMLSG